MLSEGSDFVTARATLLCSYPTRGSAHVKKASPSLSVMKRINVDRVGGFIRIREAFQN
jgi:hypothetical protein